jgi:hypothetical protein
MSKPTFISVLKENGFKKMPWEKCPQGFKESNYQCFSDEKNNRYCEVYLSDKPPYCWVVGNGIKKSGIIGGQFTYEPNELKKLLQ